MMPAVRILGGGAAHGLVEALAPRFKAETGCEIEGTYGPVGAMREKLLAGEPADLLILSRALIDELARQGHLAAVSARDIGTVQTAIAVRRGDPVPMADSAETLRAVLLAAGEIYFPDPQRATAGIHFASVLERLGIAAQVASRIRNLPAGLATMRALGESSASSPVGCTQVTEILSVPSVTLVAPLPDPFGLTTVYAAAVSTRAERPDQAQALVALLAGSAAAEARRQAGFI